MNKSCERGRGGIAHAADMEDVVTFRNHIIQLVFIFSARASIACVLISLSGKYLERDWEYGI